MSVGGSSFSMGYVLSSPVAREDGSLSIRYQGGSLCHKNTPFESHRSTRINFFCSQVEVSVSLVCACFVLFEFVCQQISGKTQVASLHFRKILCFKKRLLSANTSSTGELPVHVRKR